MTFSFPILPDFVVKHYLAVAPSKKSQLKAGYAAHITKYVRYRGIPVVCVKCMIQCCAMV